MIIWRVLSFINADAQTVISFLKTYGLDKDFKVQRILDPLTLQSRLLSPLFVTSNNVGVVWSRLVLLHLKGFNVPEKVVCLYKLRVLHIQNRL